MKAENRCLKTIHSFLLMVGFILFAISFMGIAFSGLIRFELSAILTGLVTGLLYVLIGITLTMLSANWQKSMEFVSGYLLREGSIINLFKLSIIAGIYEEGYTRLFVLWLFTYWHVALSKLLLIALVLNFWFTANHLFNNGTKFYSSPVETARTSLPHLILIFLSGIPLFAITLITKSPFPTVIAHFLLDFFFGLYYRYKKPD